MIYAVHPEDFKQYSTDQVRQHFLLPEIFLNDQITHYYTHYDRLVVGGIAPTGSPLQLEAHPSFKSNFYLERREIGIINVEKVAARVVADATEYKLEYMEALYIGAGTKRVEFYPSHNGEVRLYYNSAPAHRSYPSKRITLAEAETVELGALETANHRTIRKLIINSVVPTCQLQMGLTELKPGSVWNTMPPHTHDRRMEAYFYFALPENSMVCHFLGEPDETRHIWVKNHQAVLSPPWSIHCGAGTTNYAFIWGMAGENLDYADMDIVKVENLR